MSLMIKLLFQKRSLVWDFKNRNFTWYSRVFYWVKTFICILFRLYKEGTSYDEIAMLAWGFSPGSYEFGGERWEELSVGIGVFENWYCVIYSNGYP